MHIPDGFVSPALNAASFAVSAAVCAVAARRAEKTFSERHVPLMGMTAAFVFAAQMINFPVVPGASGHFLGAFMAAVLVGPLNACLVMAVVLFIQCILFADGGITALGTNIFNMGIAGGIGGWAVFSAARAFLPKGRPYVLAASAVAAWASVVGASALCAAELALSGVSPMEAVLPALAGVHSVIGLGEAAITSTVLSMVMSVRPDLLGAASAKGTA